MQELTDSIDKDDLVVFIALFKERLQYYNYQRHHSAIGYVTPYAIYTGKAVSNYQKYF